MRMVVFRWCRGARVKIKDFYRLVDFRVARISLLRSSYCGRPYSLLHIGSGKISSEFGLDQSAGISCLLE